MKDRPILFLAIAQMLIWACIYYSFPALLLHWEQSLGWSRADLTGAITLAVFVSAFCSPLYGRLIDAGRGALMMTAAAAIGGSCMILLSLVEQLWQFYLLWAVIGLCMAGSLYEPCFALITRARGAEAKRSIIFVTLVAGFAGTISFPVAHSLVLAFGWRSTVLFFGAVAILVVAPLMWLGASAVERAGAQRHSANPHLSVAERSFLRSPVFWCLAFGFGFAAMLQGITLHHLLPILSERKIHPDVAVIAISFIGPMQVAGRLVMIAAERRVSIHGIAIACFVLMAASIVFLIVAGVTPALLIAFVILFGGSYGVVSIIRPVIARNLLGERQFGAKSGALALVYLVGSASAPFLGAVLWGWGGYGLVLPGLILLAVVGLLLYLVAQKKATSS
jgi:predicted MFS family arabinose efflux permease